MKINKFKEYQKRLKRLNEKIITIIDFYQLSSLLTVIH